MAAGAATPSYAKKTFAVRRGQYKSRCSRDNKEKENMGGMRMGRRWGRRLLSAAAVLGGSWLAARFLLPWCAPFLLGFALAALIEPLVRALVRRGWPRGAAAGLVDLVLLALLIRGCGALIGRGLEAVSRFAREAPALMTGLAQTLGRLEEGVLSLIAQAPEELERTLRLALDAMGESLYGLPAVMSQWALDAAARLAGKSPDLLLFVVTAGIGSYFCSASFPRVLAFLEAQVPESLKRRLEGMGEELKGSLGGWLRAQLLLMGITFCELLAAFLLLKIPSPAAMAALTAVVDALPLFGTGVIMVPWAVYCLLLGQSTRGLGLLICWGGVSLVRSCIEAKLLGDQIGLPPLASLMAMYVGWRVWSVWGMLLFPMLLVTARQLNDRGVVRLWKRI